MTTDLGQLHDKIACAVEELRGAYQSRDMDRLMRLFADDASITLAPGTFRGKAAVRKVFEWDAGLSPTVEVRDAGVGVVVAGRTAVWERVIALRYKDIPYEERAVTILEFGDDGLIRDYRSYYDKLDVLDQISSRLPGPQGWFTRKLVGYLVNEGKKGLDVTPS